MVRAQGISCRVEPVSPCVGTTCPCQGRLRLASGVKPTAKGTMLRGQPSRLPPCPPGGHKWPSWSTAEPGDAVSPCVPQTFVSLTGCFTHCAHFEGWLRHFTAHQSSLGVTRF